MAQAYITQRNSPVRLLLRNAIIPELSPEIVSGSDLAVEIPASTTRIPLEAGSVLTDHIIDDPVQLRLDGFVSDLVRLDGTPAEPDDPGNAWRALRDIRDRKDLLEIVTPYDTYSNMAIVSLTARQGSQTGLWLEFSLRLQEIRTLEPYRDAELDEYRDVRPTDPIDEADLPDDSRIFVTDGNATDLYDLEAGQSIPAAPGEFQTTLGKQAVRIRLTFAEGWFIDVRDSQDPDVVLVAGRSLRPNALIPLLPTDLVSGGLTARRAVGLAQEAVFGESAFTDGQYILIFYPSR